MGKNDKSKSACGSDETNALIPVTPVVPTFFSFFPRDCNGRTEEREGRSGEEKTEAFAKKLSEEAGYLNVVEIFCNEDRSVAEDTDDDEYDYLDGNILIYEPLEWFEKDT